MSEPQKNPFSDFFDEIRRIIKEEIRAATTPKELYTPEELAEKLKLPVSWVYEQSRQGQLPTHRLGRYIRFDLQEVLNSPTYQKKNGSPS